MLEKKTTHEAIAPVEVNSDGASAQDQSVDTRSSKIPLSVKITAVCLVSMIGFGSHWSTGVTGAMKSTLKKVKTTRDQRQHGRFTFTNDGMALLTATPHQQHPVRTSGRQ
jgi:hypothetical protein